MGYIYIHLHLWMISHYSFPVKNHQGNSPNLWSTCKSWERWTRPWASAFWGNSHFFDAKIHILTGQNMANLYIYIYYSNIFYEEIIEMRMNTGGFSGMFGCRDACVRWRVVLRTDPKNLAVLIPNYVNSQSNCLLAAQTAASHRSQLDLSCTVAISEGEILSEQ